MLAVAGFVGNSFEPLLGVLGDTAWRRRLMLTGGGFFAVSLALAAGATGFLPLLVAFALGNPATTPFVSFAQAWLIDLEPESPLRALDHFSRDCAPLP